MVPPMNYRPNQVHTHGTTTASAPQQQVNPTNFPPNPAQVQMGLFNPISAPPNRSFPQQNPFGGQCQGGGSFYPQNSIQPSTHQFFTPPPPNNNNNNYNYNYVNNLPQYPVLPNGQICLQNPMQNVANQFVQMPIPNYTQMFPCNMNPYPNQTPPVFFANPQFGLVHSNAALQPTNHHHHHNHNSVPMDVNATRQSHNNNNNITQQSQGNFPPPPTSGSVPLQQTYKDFRPPVFRNSQGNLRKDGGINNSNNWKNSENRNFKKNLRDASHRGFSKSQFHNKQNGKGKSRFHNKYGGKGYKNKGARCELPGSNNQTLIKRRRFLSWSYTEKEIKQWREARRKNYPSKSNAVKKQAEKMTDAKLRRQQLKQILAEQAELGCEVAEIPSYYLSDSEKEVHGQQVDNKALIKKERFQTKRKRFHQNERFAKKQQLADHDSSNLPNQDEGFSKKQKSITDNDSCIKPILNIRKPTLLQKLLSTEMRRDKSWLFQIFRFMVMNSFFKHWPQKPLRFPSVIVKESAALEGQCEYGDLHCDDEGANDGEDDNINGDENDNALAKAPGYIASSIGCSTQGKAEEPDEEEGEIID